MRRFEGFATQPEGDWVANPTYRGRGVGAGVTLATSCLQKFALCFLRTNLLRMRTLSMFLTLGIVLALGAPTAQAATTTNAYATASTRSAVDPQVRANINRATGSACPVILVGRDKMPQAVCSRFLGTPVIRLFDTTGRKVLATRALDSKTVVKGNPAYLDERGWMVIANGDGVLWRVNHGIGFNNRWDLGRARSAVLTWVVPAPDRVIGLQPDSAGHVWFASAKGVVGTADTSYNEVRKIRLPNGETVVKDLAASGRYIVVTSNRAVYRVTASSTGAPRIVERRLR